MKFSLRIPVWEGWVRRGSAPCRASGHPSSAARTTLGLVSPVSISLPSQTRDPQGQHPGPRSSLCSSTRPTGPRGSAREGSAQGQVLSSGERCPLVVAGGGLFDRWAPWSEEGFSAGPPAGWGATQPHEDKSGVSRKNAMRVDACRHWRQVGEGGRVPLWGVTDSRWAGGAGEASGPHPCQLLAGIPRNSTAERASLAPENPK